jgi:hypothetical protein
MGIDQDFDLELRIGENGKRNETNIQEKRRNLGVARWGPSIEKKRT